MSDAPQTSRREYSFVHRAAWVVLPLLIIALCIPRFDGERTESSGHFDRRILAGTDIASFYLFHPDDLQHRRTSPVAWTCYHFACRPEFEAGRLVAFDTGGDGGYAFRVTDGELTEREQKWLASSWDFRYVVRHGLVYLDGGYALPCDDYFDDSGDNPEQWIPLPNGNYKVTVNAIEWHSEPGAVDANGNATDQALPSYVIQFKPVDDLQAIAVSSTPPRLETSREIKPTPTRSFAESETFDDTEVELADSYVTLVKPDVTPVPGCQITTGGTEELFHAMYGSRGNMVLPGRIEQLILASSDKTPCIGVLVTRGGAHKAGNEPREFYFRAKRLVTVTMIEPTTPWATGTVTALDRPESTVSVDQLDTLKRAFTEYAKVDQAYRRTIPNPDFEAERVASMNSAAGVTHVLIHHVQMPMATRLQLLPLSDAERVERLAAILQPTGSASAAQ